MSTASPPRILSIAGSDSSGGAGIQADIKTITMLGGYAMTAVTAATAQNTIGVQAIAPMGGAFVGQQIASCVEDIGVDAVKIGMLHDRDIIEHVAKELDRLPQGTPIVLDPVMIATSGSPLIAPDAMAAIEDLLFSRATLLTPNLPELEHMAERELRDTGLMESAAAELARSYDTYVLAKGGHSSANQVIDLLVAPDGRALQYSHTRIDTPHTHGTGCTLSAAIATLLGHGQPLDHAITLARNFVYRAIEAAPGFGSGSGPLGHQLATKQSEA
ncbi:MAG: bifunctional hydroxymethylpyrimidine kinase/phosphomethylpyrimidine kinase [Altererythrobacter sp. XM-24bin4]|jgi:hydroxymethylpyrimidine/phosphomethylpyrimidine kinase|uniref:bifunctional hydroxymethylpyrimidine kinase/phosphomethylpyrimidine kinase n=1 Tax=uncultured Altererythrobacter sp. TaxID=500840 RepID=UPI000D7956CF|nr:bifunctional hydroxymethylpyrimidine kinase/phosphomethylpyrimidine kinase [uncultured Altererythrobacter sp.]PWL24870.1 MAG: bifunctional hydroxymethylpyrimidine kinase/phosphomethylpyrimidine kinase [Altererythrobacter sp. XM-24bin4]